MVKAAVTKSEGARIHHELDRAVRRFGQLFGKTVDRGNLAAIDPADDPLAAAANVQYGAGKRSFDVDLVHKRTSFSLFCTIAAVLLIRFSKGSMGGQCIARLYRGAHLSIGSIYH